MLPGLVQIEISPHRPRPSGLFERVERFSMVDPRHGRLLVRSLELGGVTIGTVRSNGHDITLHEPGRVTFITPIHGRLNVNLAGRELDAGSGGALYLPPGRRETSVRQSDQHAFLAAVALVPWPAARRRSHYRGRAYASEALDPNVSSLGRYLRYFLEEYARPGSPLRRPAALRASGSLIADLLAGLGESDDDDAAHGTLVPEARVRRAEEIMRARSDEPLSVVDLARELGVSARALQLAFQARRGVPPRAVLNGFRLERARERLLTGASAASVSDVALMSGFAHFGRFAAAYRRAFGEAPSTTLRRTRR